MNSPDDITKEFDEMSTMLGWFGENLEKMPFACQLEFLTLMMRFCNEAKPLYIKSLVAVEQNISFGDSPLTNIVRFPCKDDWDEECWDDDEEDDSWIFDAIGEDEEE